MSCTSALSQFGLAIAGPVILIGCTSQSRVEPASPAMVRTSPIQHYELHITSDPDACSVVIDGQAVGTTPMIRLYAKPVAMVVDVSRPGYAPISLTTDAAWWQHSTAARAARRYGRTTVTRTFHARMKRRWALHVTSEPTGARVSVDQTPAGRTPVTLAIGEPSPITVQVTRDGHVPWVARLDGDWWAGHASEARLDTTINAYVVTLEAPLWKPNRTAWTRVGQSNAEVRITVQPGSVHQKVAAHVQGPGGGQDVRFLYDTGATLTTLDRATAEAIGLHVDENTPTLQSHTANGTVTNPIFLLNELTIEDDTLRNVAIMLCDSCRQGDVVGLLGLNVLREFETTFSADGREMIMVRSSARAGQRLSMSAFLKMASSTRNSAVLRNQSPIDMTSLVVELVQSAVDGGVTATVRIGPFNVRAGQSATVAADMTRLRTGQRYTLHVVEGAW